MKKLYSAVLLALGFFGQFVLAEMPPMGKSTESESTVAIGKFLKKTSIPETPMGDSPWTETK